MLSFKVDTEKCIQCGDCAKVCPVLIIRMNEDNCPVTVPEREEMCLKCQHCFTVCKPGAISIFDLNPGDSLPLKGQYPSPEQMERLIMGRRSIRHYKKSAVDSEKMDRLMEALASSPTGVNNRRQLFTLVDDPEVMQAIREKTYESLAKAAEAGALAPRYERFGSFVGPWQEKGIDIIFRGAPHMLVVSTPKDSPCPEADHFIALSHFELLAQSMGLGTVWCGYASYVFFDILPQLGRKIGIPADHENGYVIMFGKPAVTYHRTVQRKQEMVQRVRWDEDSES